MESPKKLNWKHIKANQYDHHCLLERWSTTNVEMDTLSKQRQQMDEYSNTVRQHKLRGRGRRYVSIKTGEDENSQQKYKAQPKKQQHATS